MLPAVLFALIAGYADAVGYLRFKAFAGMMTGNTVLMGLATFHLAELSVWDYATLLAIFLAAAVTILLGLIIVSHWPLDSVYVLGTLLGVDLLFHGVGWVSFGMGLYSRS